MKPLALAAVLAILLGAAPAPLQLSLHVSRNGFDLLDVVGIELVVDNTTGHERKISFAQPQEFAIEIFDGDRRIFSTPSTRAPASVAGHIRALQAGANVFATYEWNELSDEHTSPAAGRYRVVAQLLSDPHLEASADLTFIPPVPVSAIAKLKLGDEVTVAGASLGGMLTDATGSVALSRKLPPGDAIVVRGAISNAPDGSRMLVVERWASMQASKPM